MIKLPVWCKIRLPLGGSRETLAGPLGKRSGRAASDPGDCSNAAAAPAVPGGGEETRLPQTRDLPAAASRDPDPSPEPALGGAGRGTRSDGPGPCCARVRVHFSVLRPLVHVPLAITNVSGITRENAGRKDVGFEIDLLVYRQINISSLHPGPGRRKWRQRRQRPGGPTEGASPRFVSKVPDPPLRKCGHLRVTLTSTQSVERQKATFTFLNRHDGRVEGVALPRRGSPGGPAPPAPPPTPQLTAPPSGR
nr:PREDICTED: uncharacterized protein LOC109558549 [Bos indicus]